MLPDSLKADCNACQGLCCVALAFDAGPAFAFDKAAHRPCPLLATDNRCSIHGALLRRGFGGCASYDCYGAGQWVTQRWPAGVSWRTSPERAREILDAFATARGAHELMAMLTIASAQADAPLRDDLFVFLRQVEALRDDASSHAAHAVAAIRRRILPLIRQRRQALPVEVD